MTSQDILRIGSDHLLGLSDHVFDLLTITKPVSVEAAMNLSKVISKLSPLLGNLIEFNAVEFLNENEKFRPYGEWIRQDPGFPDTIFSGTIKPSPGFEIKAWFPMATEITARFKDSQNHFLDDQTKVCLIAWLPDKLIYGKPKIISVCIVSGKSVAEARDSHYHNPPDYLVLEPEDTKLRTRNLQQTNTNGYKWQGTSSEELVKAKSIVESWGEAGVVYEPSPIYQSKLRELISQFPYRLDTNFAKIDRIAHTDIEAFKSATMAYKINGLSIGEWTRLLSRGSEETVKKAFVKFLDIKDEDAEKLVK